MVAIIFFATQPYQQRLTENEARLASGLTVREEPMSPEQIETLRRVVEAQRLKIAELMSDVDEDT